MACYRHPTLGSDFYLRIAEGKLEMPDRETSIEQYQYAIERDSLRVFPLRGFGPGAWNQEGNKLIWNPSMLYSYSEGLTKKA